MFLHNNEKCKDCDKSCGECSGEKNDDCTECKGGKILYNG